MFRVLGPLEITVGERLAQPPGPRQRELLALLLLRANQVVTVGTIVKLAWGERPPPTARRQAQNCVGRLRRLMTDVGLSPKTIVTTPGGYLLRVADDQLDMLAFLTGADEGRALAGAGHVWKASRRYRSALALWRGPAFDGVALGPLSDEVDRLNERRLTVLEDCLDLELELGRHASVADELSRLVAEHPNRERLWAQLTLALFRSGRKDEALTTLERARARFEPGERLLEIEAGILRGDTGVPERPCRLPADIAGFTGREEEIGELIALLRRENGVAVTGGPGIGKTALAVHLAHRVHGLYPGGQFYACLRGAEPGEVLARFLRALGVPGQAIPDGIEERAELYQDKLADRRALIVLDDVTDAAQVGPLLPDTPRCAVIVTSRSRLDGLVSGSRLPGLGGGMRGGSALPGLGGRSGVSRIGMPLVELAPLEGGPAMTLLSRIAGPGRVAADASSARDLVRHCGGSPLAIRVAAARLAAEPRLPLAWMSERLAGRPPTEVIRLGYAGLSEPARLLLRLLGLVEAADFPAWVCAALLGTGIAEAQELAEALVDAQLLERSGPSRYRVQDVVREFTRDWAMAVTPQS